MALLQALLVLSCAAAASGCVPVQRRSAPGGGFEYTLYSHEDFDAGTKYSHNMSCTWNVLAPTGGSTWLVKFHEIDMEASVTSRRCKYDNLTVIYDFQGQRLTTVLCGRHSNLLLMTNSSFQLQFKSDSSISNQGFKVSWRAVSGRTAKQTVEDISAVFYPKGSTRSCSSLLSAAPPSTFNGRAYNTTRLRMSMRDRSYIHNADCTWAIPTRSRTSAVYVTFETVRLEGNSPCSLDNITVTYRLSRRYPVQRRVLCRTNSTLTLVSRETVTLQLRTDHSVGNELSVKWFVAPYTGIGAMFRTSSLFRKEQCPEALQMIHGGMIGMYYEPPLTYEPNMRCSWVVSVPRGKVADFNFTRFQLAAGYRSWRYNSSRYHQYCSYRDDTVLIMYQLDSSFRRQSKSFCHNSNVQLNQVALTAEGEVTITFRSNGYRNSRGFVLAYRFRSQTTATNSCPSARRLDKYRQSIGNSTQRRRSILPDTTCAWVLRPRNDNYLLSLTITMEHNMRRWMYDPALSEIRHTRFGLCDPIVIVTSESSIGRNSLRSARDRGAVVTKSYQMEFCPQLLRMPVGLFAGQVNVTITSLSPRLDIRGFILSITDVPKPKKGCSSVTVATKYRKSQTIKILTIKGQAGCIVPESVKDISMSSMYSDTALNVTFHLMCENSASTESLDVISESFVLTIKCGNNGTVFDSWKHPMVLKFPPGTDATLVSTVTYEFPVVETYCRNLNSRTTAGNNATVGSYLLPLLINQVDLPRYNVRASRSAISCNYELNYRPGYSILLHISHNLGYDDLDLYCHAKTKYRDINPHIILTAKERDPDNPGVWSERQLEMCHGHSVGSLGAKSELLIDGSVSINLQALSTGLMGGSNRTRDISTMWILRLLNTSLPQPLRFLITYQYVPSCPELACSSQNGSKVACSSTGRMSEMLMQSDLQPNNLAHQCKWSIPGNSKIRSALAKQSSVWLAKVEVKNFAISCPCHGCDTDQFGQFITVSQPAADGKNSPPEKIILCGDYSSSSKVIYLPVGQGQADVQLAYSVMESGTSVSVRFIDCQQNSKLEQCKIALQLRLMAQRQGGAAGSNSHGGLIFGTILLTALLIGCLLYMNRQALASGGGRIQDALRSRNPPPDDMLQLSPEPEESD